MNHQNRDTDSRVPTGTGRPGKMRRHIPVKENNGIFNGQEKSGKFRQRK